MTTPNASNDVEQQELSFTAVGNAKWYRNFGRQYSSFLQSPTYSYHRSEIMLPGIYPHELKTYLHTKLAHKCLQWLYL